MAHDNAYPKLHNAAWPGVVGKGPDSEPPIDLDTMLDLTAAAEVDGVKFDGVDLFLFAPHVNIDAERRRAQAAGRQGRVARASSIGSVVAPVWPPTGGGSAMGEGGGAQEVPRAGPQGLPHRQTAARAGRPALRRRPHRLGLRRRATGPTDPEGQPEADRRDLPAGRRRSPRTTANGSPPRAKSAGAACTAGGRWSTCWSGSASPRRVGFQADMAHTLLYTLGYNAPEDRILPEDFDWNDTADARRRAARR